MVWGFLNSNKLLKKGFSQTLIISGLIRKYEKYNHVNNCPVTIKGSSTGRAPIQVNKMTTTKNDQNSSFAIG